MIAIPNMKKPEYCRVCHERLKCKQYDGEILHTPDDCPLIEIVTCGECKHWYNDADCGMACEFTNMGQPINGFCSWGERK